VGALWTPLIAHVLQNYLSLLFYIENVHMSRNRKRRKGWDGMQPFCPIITNIITFYVLIESILIAFISCDILISSLLLTLAFIWTGNLEPF
jgi:hypothetical protein